MAKLLYYALKDAQGEFYYLDGSQVKTKVEQTFFADSPITWDKEQVSWKRNTTYMGVMRARSEQSHIFQGQMAKVLRHVHYNEMITGKVSLLVKGFSGYSAPPNKEVYECALDMSTFLDTRDNVQITLIEAGLIALIKAYENTPFEIPLLPDAENVLMDGVDLDTAYHFSSLKVEGKISPEVGGSFASFFPMAFIDNVGSFVTGEALTTTAVAVNDDYKKENTQFIAYREQVVKMDFDVTFSYRHDSSSSTQTNKVAIYLYVYDDDTYTSFGRTEIWTDPGSVPQNSTAVRVVTAKFTRYQTLHKNNRVILAYGMSYDTNPNAETNGDRLNITIAAGQEIIFTSRAHTDTTVIKGYRPFPLGKKLLFQLAGPGYSMQSSYLDNPQPLSQNYDSCPYLNIYTPSDALRNVGDSANPAKFRITFADYIKDLRSRYCIGVGISDDNIVIEKLSEFFQKDILLYDFGPNITKFQIAPAREMLASTLTAGYNTQTHNEIDGRDDVNAKQFYTTPLVANSLANNIDMVSPFVASMYSIEIARMNLGNKSKADSNSDNETFVLAVQQPAPGQTQNILDRRNAGGNTGIIYPATAFNLQLSPKHNLLRNTPLLASMYFVSRDNKKLAFQSADKFAAAAYNMYSGPIIENADIDYTGKDILYQPYLFTFDAITPDNLQAIMNNNPYGVFRFRINGAEFEGFVMELGYTPAHEHSSYRVVLLSSPKNDLTQLIR